MNVGNPEDAATDGLRMVQAERVGAVLFGGMLLGVWIYGLLFTFDPDGGAGQNVAAWFGWGMLGLALAAGIWGARVASETNRIFIIAGVGVLLAIITIGAVLRENADVFATLFSAAGAGLIATALPVPSDKEGPPGQE